MLWLFKECIKQELGSTNVFDHNLLDKRFVVDRHKGHMAATIVFMLIRIMT